MNITQKIDEVIESICERIKSEDYPCLEYPETIRALAELTTARALLNLTTTNSLPDSQINMRVGETEVTNCREAISVSAPVVTMKDDKMQAHTAYNKVSRLNKPEILIKTDGIKAKIYVNGKELEGVKAYKFTHNAVEGPTLHLSMVGTDVTLETLVIPALPEIYRNFYISTDELIQKGIATEEQLESL